MLVVWMKPGAMTALIVRVKRRALWTRSWSSLMGDNRTSDLILMPREPTEEMISAALAVTAAWHDLPGSALTVNREKMRRRYRAMVETVEKSYKA